MNAFLRPIVALSTVFGLGVIALACSDGKTVDNGQTTTSPTAGQVVTNADAVSRITDARCTRENRCGNVGADRKYVDNAACTSQIKGDTQSELNNNDCVSGINGTRLQDCVSEIGTEDCNNPFDKLESGVKCRKDALCLD